MTMDALAGISRGCANRMPNNEEITAIMIPNKKVCLKVVEILDAIAAGNIIREVMSNTPIDLTPITINKDVKMASKYRMNVTFTFRNTA